MPDLLFRLRRAATPHRAAGALSLAFGLWLAWHFIEVNRGLGEVGLAALALLYGGGLADPYLVMTGPTAHVSPAIAGLVAGIFALEGIGTDRARFLLGAIAALWYALAALLAVRLLAEYGVARGLRWAAAAGFVLLPFRLYDAVVLYWQYDQPAAAVILLAGWLTVVRIRRGADPARMGALLGLLMAIGGLVSPMTLPPLGLAFAWLSLRCLRGEIGRRWWSGAAFGAAIVTATLLAWGLRNEQALGRFILTRSNFGLELAQGNAPPEVVQPPAGAAPGDRAYVEASIDRLAPLRSVDAAEELARVGEVAFMQEKTEQALGWIRADIPGFLRRTATRIRAWLLPPPDDDYVYVPLVGPRGPWLLNLLIGLLTLPALLAAALLRRTAIEPLLFVPLPMAAYLITHVNTRYTYPVFFSSVVVIMLAADALLRRAPDWLHGAARAPAGERPGLELTRPR